MRVLQFGSYLLQTVWKCSDSQQRTRKKSLQNLKETIRSLTRRNNGQSLAQIIERVNRTLRGWYEYFKHSNRWAFKALDGWIRMRLRSKSFIAQWQPQGGIDLAMIDMLRQSFVLYLFWNEVSITRTETDVRADSPAWLKDKAYRERDYPRERGHGYWNPPYAHEQEAVEHAAQMADRYLRAFQRTLCALRDLRRYSSPVTINNPQQVNIAADGGQQVNAVSSRG